MLGSKDTWLLALILASARFTGKAFGTGALLAVVLVLKGVASAPYIWLAAGFFLVGKSLARIVELFDRRPSDEEMRATEQTLRQSYAEELRQAEEEGRADETFSIDTSIDRWRESINAELGPAERREIFSDLALWWGSLPLWMYAGWALTAPVLGRYGSFRWQQAGFVLVGLLLLHFSTHGCVSTRQRVRRRTRLLAGMFLFAAACIVLRHPYIIPGYPDAAKTRAERVLAARDIVTWQQHAAALLPYARELEDAGSIQKAGEIFFLALRADSTDPGILEACIGFCERQGAWQDAAEIRRLHRQLEEAIEPGDQPDYRWECAEHPLPVLPAGFQTHHAICLIADTSSPAHLIDVLGRILEDELHIPVYRKDGSISLVETDRRSGLLSRQISVERVAQSVQELIPRAQHPPVQYLVITAREIYSPGANFLYNASFLTGHGVVSYAQWSTPDKILQDREALRLTVKALLSTVIKSMGVWPSPDRRDVTCYVNGQAQMERKGLRPLPPTRFQYHQAVKQWLSRSDL